jgi:antitoxin (DNA-binding transcriptional repressor) of toxin-antitoxin stability system
MDMPVNPGRQGLAARWRTAVRPEWLIEAWLDLLPERQASTMRAVHQAVLAASPALVPCVKWGNLVYLRAGRTVAQLTPHRQAALLQLAQVGPPRRRQSGPAAGQLRFRHSESVDATSVTHEVVGLLRQLPR